MMRVLLLLCIILATSSTADGQIYDMSNNSVTDPSGTLYDSGGSSGHYISNEDYTFTICPPNPCDCLALSFEYLLVDTPGDTLYIHNGSSTAAPLVASLAGFNFPSDLFLDSGCATLRFSSNGGKNSAGWKMTWSCSCFSGEVETNTSAYTTTELIEDLFVSGNCVEVSNISFTGNSDAVGSFSNGGVIGIESGIVLSTGFINNISGPNNLNTSPGTNPFLSGVSDQLGSPGDSDLDILLDGQTTTDASSIEFDFTPTTNEISFRYVFASDEYPEFVCSDYNDVFAFFISGPGFTGSQNIALVPGTTTPVSINSINNSSIGSQGFEENCINLNNSDYYINSTGSLSFEFDGFTTILTATAPVISCEDYHIKLVIADVVDHKYDSAVFLEANSFKAGEGILISSSVTNAHASPNEMYENCESGFFLFERGNSDNTSEPLVIDFEVTGTATAGIDYSPLPSSITIPIGQTSIQIDINSFLDGISEGSESIIVTILNNICICEEGSSSAQINILDNPVIEATLPTSDYCLNDLVTLAPNVIGGISPFTYNWSAPYNVSSDLPSISFPLKLNKTGIYHVTVSDDCGNQSTASVNLEIIPIPSIPQITAVAPFCENSDPFNLQVSEVGGTWAGSGIIDTNTGTFDPATAQNISTPPFLITYTLSNYCGTVSNTINLDFTLLPTATISGNLTTCPGTAVEENLSIFFTGEAPWAFTYAVDDIEIASIENITDNPYEFIVNQIGDITLTAMNDNYCDGTFDGLATISEFSIPIATISGGGVLCNNEDFADIDFTIVNGAIPYEVIYTNGTTQFNQQIASSPFSIPVNLLGTYEIISITDANGCAGDFSGMAQVLDTDLSIDSATPNIANCQDNDGSITDVVISGGNSPYDYFWYDDADLLLSTNTILTGISTGNYTLIVIDDLLCSDTLNLSIGELPPPSINNAGIPTASLCSENNGSIIGTIFSGGEFPYSYLWKDSLNNVVGNSLDLFNVFAGNYTLLIEDINGCKDSIEVSIADFPPPNLTGGTANSANCNENNGSITGITIEGGLSPYNYQWIGESGSINNNSLDLLNISSGNYSVTVTDDNGCTQALDFTVQDTESPEINSAITNPSLCSEANGSITDIGITGGFLPFTYEWQDKDGNVVDNKLVLEGVSAGTYTLIVTDIYGCKGLSEYNITNKPSPFLNQGEVTSATCNEENGSITNINIQGDYPPFEYEWTNNSGEVVGSNIALQNVGLGDYTLEATDMNGCIAEIFFSVLSIPFPTLSEGNIIPSTCGNQNGAVQNIEIQGGVAPFTTEWYNEANELIHNTLSLQNISAGNYELIVTDANGCIANTNIEITDIPAPEITSEEATPTTCGNSNGTIQGIQIEGNTTPFTYEWYNASSELLDTTLSLQNLPAGNYEFIVTDANGCTASTNIEITDIPAPEIIGGEVSPSSCGDSDGAITGIEVSGNVGELTYEWQNHSGEILSQTATLSNVPQGSYILTIIDENGCETSENFNISDSTAPQLVGGEIQNATCGEANGSITNINIQNGTALFTFEWQNEIGETINAGEVTMNVLQLENLEEGLYTIFVTDSNDCTVSLQFTIEDSPLPQLSGGTINEATCGEPDGSITNILVEDGILPYTFEWTNASGEVIGNELNIENLEFGNYTLEVADSNNCIHRLEFLIPQISTESFDGGIITPANCGESDGSITGIIIEGNTSFFTFEWTNDAGEIVGNELDIENLESGNYTLTFTDFNTCIHTNNFFVPQTSSSPANGGIIAPANCGEADGSITEINIEGDPTLFSFEWTNEGEEVIGNELDIEGLASGSYTLQITDSNNCTNLIDFFVPQTSNSPANGGLIIPANCGESDGSITEIIIEGDPILFSFEWTNESGEVIGNELDIENLASGSYTLQITDSNNCTHTTDFFVPQTSSSPIDGGLITPANCGESDGSITEINIEGDPTFFSFEWINEGEEVIGNELDIAGLESGSYTLQITDSNNCTYLIDFFVPETSISPIDGGLITPANCGESNGSITEINIEGDPTLFSFEWTNESGEVIGNELDIENLASGSYTFQITDSNNCVYTTDFFVPETSSSPTNGGLITPANCGESDGSITEINIEGDPTLFSFEWINESGEVLGNDLDIENLASGNYTLQITDFNNCVHATDFFVPQISDEPLEGGLIMPSNCGEANGSITEIIIEGDPILFNFEWTNESGEVIGNELDIENLELGNYTFTFTDLNNCIHIVDFFVPQTINSPLQGGLVNPSNCGETNGSITEINVESDPTLFIFEWRNTAGEIIGNELDLTDLSAGEYTLFVTDENGCESTEAFIILDEAAPELTGGTVSPSNCEQADGSITDISIEGGAGSYTFLWTDDIGESHGEDIDLLDIPQGNYLLTATDGAGCVAILSFEVIGTDAPELSGGVVNPEICDGINGGIEAIEVNGGNGLLDFTWFNSNDIEIGTNLDLNSVSAGTYTLVVRDEKGCTAELEFEIPHDSPPQILEGTVTNARCAQANGSIENINIEGGITPITFTWTDADSNTYPNTGETPNLLNAAAGIYTLEVMDANNCSSSIEFEILNEANLIVSGGLVNASTCSEANGSIEAINIEEGLEPFDYEWRDSNNSLVGTAERLEEVMAGNYTLNITDSNGCEASLAFEILDIAAPVLTDGTVGLSSCGNSDGGVLGVNIEGGTEPYVFRWQNAEGELFGDEIDLTNVTAGDYTLFASDANDCEVSLGFNISDIGAPTISGGFATNTICGSSDGRISGIEVSGGTGNLSIRWTNVLGELLSENVEISSLLAGEYTLTIEDENGCVASENFVIEDILPPSILGATVNSASCGANDGSITGLIVEEGTPLFDYEWRFVETNQIIGNTPEIENLAAGIYALTITDDNDCMDSQQFEITNPDAPELNLEEVTVSECGEIGTGTATIGIVGGTAPIQIEWNTDPPQFTPTAINLQPGEYEVTVIDVNDCRATLTAMVTGSILPPVVDCGIQNTEGLEFVWTQVEGAIFYRIETDLGTIDTVSADQLFYLVAGVPADATVNISVMALGSEQCGNSEAANHNCTKLVECDPIEVSIGLPNDAFCINETPILLTTNPEGGGLEGNGLIGNLFNPMLAGLGEHTINYTYTDEMGCDFSASETIVVVEEPFAAMSLPEVICLGDRASISFEGNLPVGASLQWDFGNGDFSDAVGPHNVEWNETGIYTVQLSINNGICVDETSMEIVVSNIGLDVSENQLVESGTEIDLSATVNTEYGDLTRLEWASSFDNLTGCNDCPNTSARPFDATYYEVTAINEHGCEANEEIFIDIIPVPVLVAPNAFSPNGDGINDIFKFEGKHLTSIEFSIFSRWGQKLFEGNSLEDYWDGSFKGQTAELGVYVYYARAFSLEGEEIFLQGNISLVR